MSNEQKLLFSLIRYALGGTIEACAPCDEKKFVTLCESHGVMQIVFAGIERMNHEQGIRLFSSETILRMYAAVEQQKKWMSQKRQLCLEFLERIDLPCVVLKGLDYSSFWPVKEWRLFGDLDVWSLVGYEQFNKQAEKIGCRINNYGYYKHNDIFYKDLMIENHQYLTTFDDTKTGKELELTLQHLVKDNGNEFRAIFMVVHAHQHFFWEGFSLKILMDWLFFVQKEGKYVDWQTVIRILEKAKIVGFCYLMTAFCVLHLGLVAQLVPTDLAKYDKIRATELADFTEAVFATPTKDGKFYQLTKRFQKMWHFRSILGTSVFVRIKNTLVYSKLHKKPTLNGLCNHLCI